MAVRYAGREGRKFLLDLHTGCPLTESDYTTDHLLFECELLRKERNDLTATILKTDVWPTGKPGLIKKHFKAFFKFMNAILIDKLTNPKPNGDHRL